MASKIPVDALIRLALIYGEQDRDAMAEAAKGSPEGVAATELARQFHEYRMKRWGCTALETSLDGAKLVAVSDLRFTDSAGEKP